MKTKQFLTILIAMLMCVSIAQWASAAGDDLADVGPAGENSEAEAALAEQLADIEADKAAMVDDLVARFATDDVTADQLAATLAAMSAADLAEIDLNAGSLDEANGILAGPEDFLRVGDLTRDYTYTPVTPCRIVNTTGGGGGGLFLPGQVRDYYVYGPVGAQPQFLWPDREILEHILWVVRRPMPVSQTTRRGFKTSPTRVPSKHFSTSAPQN